MTTTTSPAVRRPRTTTAKAAPKTTKPVAKLENAYLATKEPSELHKNMAKWIEETTGYTPDLKTVQMVCALRMDFQKSDANQNDLKARREAAAKRTEERAARAAKIAEEAKVRAEKLRKAATTKGGK